VGAVVFKNQLAASDQALEILEANPNPVEAPITNTFLAPFIAPFDFICFFYILFASIWVSVKQINPLILGSIIILYRLIVDLQFQFSYKHFIFLQRTK
jgi:hypothetical protein